MKSDIARSDPIIRCEIPTHGILKGTMEMKQG